MNRALDKYLALDQSYITEEEFNTTQDLCIQTSRIIWGLVKSLRTKSGWVTGLKILVLGLFLHLGIIL